MSPPSVKAVAIPASAPVNLNDAIKQWGQAQGLTPAPLDGRDTPRPKALLGEKPNPFKLQPQPVQGFGDCAALPPGEKRQCDTDWVQKMARGEGTAADFDRLRTRMTAGTEDAEACMHDLWMVIADQNRSNSGYDTSALVEQLFDVKNPRTAAAATAFFSFFAFDTRQLPSDQFDVKEFAASFLDPVLAAKTFLSIVQSPSPYPQVDEERIELVRGASNGLNALARRAMTSPAAASYFKAMGDAGDKIAANCPKPITTFDRKTLQFTVNPLSNSKPSLFTLPIRTPAAAILWGLSGTGAFVAGALAVGSLPILGGVLLAIGGIAVLWELFAGLSEVAAAWGLFGLSAAANY